MLEFLSIIADWLFSMSAAEFACLYFCLLSLCYFISWIPRIRQRWR